MSSPALSPRARFATIVARPESRIDLAEAALLIAAEEYPQLVPLAYTRRLDLLGERARDRLANETAPPVVLQELGTVLFEQEGYRGNVEAYYDPRNSFFNDVLDRRLGIPLTLSMLYLEVGWRLDLPVVGVNFPGHFLVRYEGETMRIMVDPFQQGRMRFEDEMQELLDRLYGGTVQMRGEFLRAADRRDMLVRLLANLKGIYLNTRDDVRALSAVERILLVQPEATEEIRDRGFLLARTGRPADAIADLERYLDAQPEAPDAARVQMLIDQLGTEGA